MVVACFTLGRAAHAESLTAPAVGIPTGAALVTAMLLGMQATIFTYDGWDGAIYFGDEMKNPGYFIPRAIFASLGSLFAIYLLTNAALLYFSPMNQIAVYDFSLAFAPHVLFR